MQAARRRLKPRAAATSTAQRDFWAGMACACPSLRPSVRLARVGILPILFVSCSCVSPVKIRHWSAHASSLPPLRPLHTSPPSEVDEQGRNASSTLASDPSPPLSPPSRGYWGTTRRWPDCPCFFPLTLSTAFSRSPLSNSNMVPALHAAVLHDRTGHPRRYPLPSYLLVLSVVPSSPPPIWGLCLL